MGKVFVFGHKNPDTDSICSSIVYANLKKQLGMDAEPVRLGEINGETKYVLDYFQIQTPRFVENVADEAEEVIMVDHNEFSQSADGIENVKILEVIDHHRIANFQTSDPLYMRVEPVGCTATILNKLYKENNIAVTKEMAGLMLSAIISDTLLFKSPTCTEQDIAAAKELAAIAGVDVEKYGLKMLKAGTDLSGKTPAELISLDAKAFELGGTHIVVAQVNAVDTNDVMKYQTELEQEMQKVIDAKNLDLFLLVVTDILNSNSVALALGKETRCVENAFDVTLENNTALLKGIVSRKKQIIPKLTDAFAKIEA